MQTGRVWVWDASITVRVRKRYEEKVNGLLQKRVAEIHEGIATIFRRATSAQLKEPGLETINRQLTAYLDEVFGKDTTGDEPVSHIERVLIPRCRGFPAE
jgi:flagellar basal body-associated protein FliL